MKSKKKERKMGEEGEEKGRIVCVGVVFFLQFGCGSVWEEKAFCGEKEVEEDRENQEKNGVGHQAVFSAESKISGQKVKSVTVPFYYSSTIQARVYYSLFYSRFLFCLFKEARSSFVSTLNFLSQAYALPSLFFLSHHVTPSSFQAFSKLSYHCPL